MEKFLSVWRSAHSFVLKNFLILILLPVLFFVMAEMPENPRIFSNMSYDMAEESSDGGYAARGGMAMDAPVAMMSKSSRIASNFIAPDVMAEDGFDESQSDRKIIKNGSLNLQGDDTDVMRSEIENKIKKDFKGKIQNVNSWQVRKGVLGYNLSARIPSENLDAALVELGKMGEKTGENISSQDITRQYYDTENKLKNMKARRDRLRKLLEFETESLADVLSVDRELTNVQNQIENLQNTQNRRDTDVAYSTLRVSIQPLPQIGDVNNPHWSAKQSWRMAVNNLIEKGRGIFDFVLKYLVLAPVWVPVLVVLWWLKRKFWNTKKK